MFKLGFLFCIYAGSLWLRNQKEVSFSIGFFFIIKELLICFIYAKNIVILKDKNSFYDGRNCIQLREFKESCNGDNQCNHGLLCNLFELTNQTGNL